MELFRYRSSEGHEPFSDWLNGLRDKVAAARIRVRLLRVAAGNLGDCQPVGDGVHELRIHVGPGYRVYFGRHGEAVILLLCGGDKATQSADIRRAKDYWVQWKGGQTS